MRSSIPMSCSDPDMRMLNSLLLNILSQSKPITSAKPFLKSECLNDTLKEFHTSIIQNPDLNLKALHCALICRFSL